MLKPVAFQRPFIALRNIPYLCGLPEERDHTQGGVLCQGQKVWIHSDAVPDRNRKLEAAFVEDLGIVSLDPHWLIPAQFVAPRTQGDADGHYEAIEGERNRQAYGHTKRTRGA